MPDYSELAQSILNFATYGSGKEQSHSGAKPGWHKPKDGIRRVRTPEGARFYGVPIGTPIKAAKLNRESIKSGQGPLPQFKGNSKNPLGAMKDPKAKTAVVTKTPSYDPVSKGTIQKDTQPLEFGPNAKVYVLKGKTGADADVKLVEDEEELFRVHDGAKQKLGSTLLEKAHAQLESGDWVHDETHHGKDNDDLTDHLPDGHEDHPDLPDEEPKNTDLKGPDGNPILPPKGEPKTDPKLKVADKYIQGDSKGLLMDLKNQESSFQPNAPGKPSQISPYLTTQSSLKNLDQDGLLNDWKAQKGVSQDIKKKGALIEALHHKITHDPDATTEQKHQADETFKSYESKVKTAKAGITKGKKREPDEGDLLVGDSYYTPGVYKKATATSKVSIELHPDGSVDFIDKNGNKTSKTKSYFAQQYKLGMKVHTPFASDKKETPKNEFKTPTSSNAKVSNQPDKEEKISDPFMEKDDFSEPDYSDLKPGKYQNKAGGVFTLGPEGKVFKSNGEELPAPQTQIALKYIKNGSFKPLDGIPGYHPHPEDEYTHGHGSKTKKILPQTNDNGYSIKSESDQGVNGDGRPENVPELWGHYGASGVMVRSKGPDGKNRYLLVQRSKNTKNFAGMWQLPGGAKSSNETDKESAAREFVEELNVPEGWLAGLEHKGDNITEADLPSGKKWTYNNLTADHAEMFDINGYDEELGGAKWVSEDELNGLKSSGKLHPALAPVMDDLLNSYDSKSKKEKIEAESPEAKNVADQATVTADPSPELADWEKELIGKPELPTLENDLSGNNSKVSVVIGGTEVKAPGDGTGKMYHSSTLSTYSASTKYLKENDGSWHVITNQGTIKLPKDGASSKALESMLAGNNLVPDASWGKKDLYIDAFHNGKNMGKLPKGGKWYSTASPDMAYYRHGDDIFELDSEKDSILPLPTGDPKYNLVKSYTENGVFPEDFSAHNGPSRVSVMIGKDKSSLPAGGKLFIKKGDDPATSINKIYVHPEQGIFAAKPQGDGVSYKMQPAPKILVPILQTYTEDGSYVEHPLDNNASGVDSSKAQIYINGTVVAQLPAGGLLYKNVNTTDVGEERYYQHKGALWKITTSETTPLNTINTKEKFALGLASGDLVLDSNFDPNLTKDSKLDEYRPLTISGIAVDVSDLPPGGQLYHHKTADPDLAPTKYYVSAEDPKSYWLMNSKGTVKLGHEYTINNIKNDIESGTFVIDKSWTTKGNSPLSTSFGIFVNGSKVSEDLLKPLPPNGKLYHSKYESSIATGYKFYLSPDGRGWTISHQHSGVIVDPMDSAELKDLKEDLAGAEPSYREDAYFNGLGKSSGAGEDVPIFINSKHAATVPPGGQLYKFDDKAGSWAAHTRVFISADGKQYQVTVGKGLVEKPANYYNNSLGKTLNPVEDWNGGNQAVGHPVGTFNYGKNKITIKEDGHADYQIEGQLSQPLPLAAINSAFKNGLIKDVFGNSIPTHGLPGTATKHNFFDSEKGLTTPQLKKHIVELASIDNADVPKFLDKMGEILPQFDSKKLLAYSKYNGFSTTPTGTKAAVISAMNNALGVANGNIKKPTLITETPKLGIFDVNANGYAVKSKVSHNVSDIYQSQMPGRAADIALSYGTGSELGANIDKAKPVDAERWIVAVSEGKMNVAYNIEEKNGLNPSPLHPGHPLNTATHKIQWQPAVNGEVAAGLPIAGNHPHLGPYDGGSWTSQDYADYMKNANAINAPWMSDYEKKQWVDAHLNGNQPAVDAYSLEAEIRRISGKVPQGNAEAFSNPTMPDKPFKAKLTKGLPANQWSSQDIDDFLDHEGLSEATKHFPPSEKMKLAEDRILHNIVKSGDEENLAFQSDDPEKMGLVAAGKDGIEGGNNGYNMSKFKDKWGKVWVWKPYPNSNESFRADVENAANRVARAFGFETAKSKTMNFNGYHGQLQGYHDKVGGVSHWDMHKLTTSQLQDIAREHVLDWAIENDDGHGGNMAMLRDGKEPDQGKGAIVGIDKGRSWFRYGEWDGLNPDNLKSPNCDAPIYRDLYQQIADGNFSKEQIDSMYKAASIRSQQMAKVKDETIREHMAEGFKDRPFKPGQSLDDLIQKAIDRKNNLPADIDKLWTRIYAKTAHQKPERPKPASVNAHGQTVHSGLTPEFLDDVKSRNRHGYSTFFAGTDIEDGELFGWMEKRNGKVIMQAQMKARSAGLERLNNFLMKNVSNDLTHSNVAKPDSGAKLTNQEDYWAVIRKALGNIDAHAVDKNYKYEEKIKPMFDLAPKIEERLKEIQALRDGPTWTTLGAPKQHELNSESGMLTQYAEHIKNGKQAYETQTGVDRNIPKYSFIPLDDPAQQSKTKDLGLKITRSHAYRHASAAKDVYGGANVYKHQKDEDADLFETSDEELRKGSDGDMYIVELPSGERIDVRTTGDYNTGTETDLSRQGTINFHIPDPGDAPASMTRIRRAMEHMGLPMEDMSEEDHELQYWRRLAGTMRDRNDSKPSDLGAYKPFWNAFDGTLENKGGPEEIAMWRNAFAKFPGFDEVKIKDFIDAQGHMPQYKHHDLKNPTVGNGNAFWKRFDVPDEKAQELNALYHHFETHSTANIMAESGGLYPTDKRLQMYGAWYAGQSSEADQDAGSAQHTFLRMNMKDAIGAHILIEPHVFQHLHGYGYAKDRYGRLSDRSMYAPFNLDTMLNMGLQDNNEFMVKNGLSILDDIAVIRFPDEASRQKIIDYYKKNGVHSIRGIPIEERFLRQPSKLTDEQVKRLGLRFGEVGYG